MTSPSYVIAKQLLLQAYPSADPKTPVLLEANADGTLQVSALKTADLERYMGSENTPLFSVWNVPPQDMSAGPYVMADWSATRATAGAGVPDEATALAFFDKTDGGLNRTTGIYTVPTDGIYRHHMYFRARTYGGNYGIFVQINGLRHVGDFFAVMQDPSFDDRHSFSTEIWHKAGDHVCFQLATTESDGGGADGVLAHWSAIRIYDGSQFGVPGDE